MTVLRGQVQIAEIGRAFPKKHLAMSLLAVLNSYTGQRERGTAEAVKRCDHDPLAAAVPFAESLINRLIEQFRNQVGCSEHKVSCTLFTRQKRKGVLKVSFAVRPPGGDRAVALQP